MAIPFCKFHGFGNDYIVIERDDIDATVNLSHLAKAICHRNTGAGSDGIAVLERLDGTDADYFCEIINPDGSIAGFSGNGTDTASAHGKWHSERFGNLASAGEGRLVFVRFRISTGTLGQAEGWFVDNVMFTEGMVGSDLERNTQHATIRPNIIAANALLEFHVKHEAEVEVRLIDPVGRIVSKQNLGIVPAGAQSVALDCSQLSNGGYFYELQLGETVVRGRLMVHR